MLPRRGEMIDASFRGEIFSRELSSSPSTKLTWNKTQQWPSVFNKGELTLEGGRGGLLG